MRTSASTEKPPPCSHSAITCACCADSSPRRRAEDLWFKAFVEQFGFPAAVEWRDSGRPLPEPGPGSFGEQFMTPPAKGARSQWSRDVTGKRDGKAAGQGGTTAKGANKRK